MTERKTAEDHLGTENPIDVAAEGDLSGAEALAGPVYLPRVPSVSGRYQFKAPAIGMEAVSEQLRLDVDGTYPQMVASGTIWRQSIDSVGVHWIADLTETGRRSWTGNIWFKDNLGGKSSYPLPYTSVTIVVSGASIYSLTPPTATVTFSGGGSPDRVRSFKWMSQWFHAVEFEFDRADGVTAVTSLETGAHPNHPSSLPNHRLSIETVFSHAGFEVSKSGKDNIVPLAGAGGDALWSNSELHDAMQTYWSRFDNQAKWSAWTFFAWLHMGFPDDGVTPDDLGGIMFDDIGPNHRQGAAIFNGSFISQAPTGDPAPAAWVQRRRFWTAVHELGHTCNLAHSWEKSLPSRDHRPWIPLANEPEERSFMNSPGRVSGGQSAFFSDFEYRFSDTELLFMRHAPERFTQMGNAEWSDDHGFRQAHVSREPKLRLELRVNRQKALYEFMEPVVLELKLSNVSDEPQLIQENLLAHLDEMIVIVKKHDRSARQVLPYARYCFSDKNRVLMPNQAVYESLFVSAGRGGWSISEPGYYTVQLALHLEGEDLVSNALRLRVAPPCGYEEEFLAQELFSDEVGRILAFDGSQFFAAGNDTLREIAEKLGERRIALHARVALATPWLRDYKHLVLPSDTQACLRPAAEIGGKFKIARAQLDDASRELTLALVDQAEAAASTLGHIDAKFYTEQYASCLAEHGRGKEAARAQDALYQTLANRKILPEVLERIQARRDSYKGPGRKS